MNTITPLQKALYTIQKLKQRLEEQAEKKWQPIAIVGLSCRFPQAENKDEYWKLLSQGKNIIAPLSEERWKLLKNTKEGDLRKLNIQPRGGFLENISAFDAYFFGISPREALHIDPQQRLLLEVSYEAFEDAGLTKEKLAGLNMGVFASLYASQYFQLQKLESDLDALFIPTGNATSIAANRISYLFDLRGPSMVIDTACSSSLVALQIACLHLQNKLCDTALVCAAHINLLPSIHVLLSKAKMLSPDAQCKTFDAEANGYVQGEGAGALVLKPLKKALVDKDHIYAVIAGGALNQDGKTNGLTAPNGLQQEALLKAAYSSANIDPKEISYVECHGTGTFLGDPIEMQALGEVISKHRNSENPCWISSVKTNIGHLEPAAGIASVIKVILALQHHQIPPHLNFAKPNPHIAFDKYHFRVPQKLEEWMNYSAYRIAGVSAFGFGGANAHVVIREMTEQEKNSFSTENRSEFLSNIPLHVWQRKIYWPDLEKEISPMNKKRDTDYPFQGQQLASPLSVLQFEFQFDTETIPEIRDTYHVLHVGYYLEMLGFAVKHLSQRADFSVFGLEFSMPIIVADNHLVKVQLILEKHTEQSFLCQFYSQQPDQESWSSHAKGELLLKKGNDLPIFDSPHVFKQRCITCLEGEKFYKRISDMQMPAGESIRWTKKAWLGSSEIFCELKKPLLIHGDDEFSLKIHFGIFDGTIQTLFMLLPEQMDKPYVAARMEKFSYFGLKKPPSYLTATLKMIVEDGKSFVGDWYLFDEADQIIATCENVHMMQLSNVIPIEKLAQLNKQIKQDFNSASITKDRETLINFLREQIAVLFAMPKEEVNIHHPLHEMGLDSLLAIAFSKIIETGTGHTYTLQSLLQGVSIAQIAEELLENTTHGISAVSDQSIAWISYRKRQNAPQVKLFCFPYGGGGASIYRDWQQELSSVIEVCPVQLPGREERLNETPLHDIVLTVEQLAQHLQDEWDKPFAFFGHSFGSLLAFELTRYFYRKGLVLPIHLFISAYPDPCIPTKSLDNLMARLRSINLDLFALRDANSLASLTDEQLRQLAAIFSEQGLINYGNQLIDKEIVKVLLPIFVGDMNIVKSYRYYNAEPLDVPMTVFIGKNDTWVAPEDHMGWMMQTKRACDFYTLNSGHLFIREAPHQKEVLKKIRDQLLEACSK